MKNILTLIILILLTNNLIFSQDVLLFQDGSKKDVTILEVTPEIVKYNKFNSTSQAVYTEDKYNLIGVIFEDGEFEKFDTRRGNSSNNSNSNIGDYGSNMFFLEPIAPLIGGYIGVGYEHFSKSGKSSIIIPFRIQVADYSWTYNSYNLITIGFKHKFFPTGSNGSVRGFLGYAERIGAVELRGSYYYNVYDSYSDYYYNSYFFNETQFIGGVQFHPSKLINITLDAGIGLGLLDFDDTYLSWDANLSLGFRF